MYNCDASHSEHIDSNDVLQTCIQQMPGLYLSQSRDYPHQVFSRFSRTVPQISSLPSTYFPIHFSLSIITVKLHSLSY
jgi:hypothetical protein